MFANVIINDKEVNLLHRSAKVSKSNAFAYFSTRKLEYATLK